MKTNFWRIVTLLTVLCTPLVAETELRTLWITDRFSQPLLETHRAPRSFLSPTPQCGRGVIFATEYLPGHSQRLKSKLSKFLGRPITPELLQEVSCVLEKAYGRSCYPFTTLSIPPQEISDGTVRVVVRPALLEKVCVKGTRYTPEEYLRSQIRLAVGRPINLCCLKEDLGWLNRKAYRCTEAIFSPGDRPGTTALELVSCECKPWHAYYGWDNRGNVAIGHNRQFAGVQLSNVFVRDDALCAQATFSGDPRYLKAIVCSYEWPLPWRHLLWIYAGYARVKTKLLDEAFHNKGRNVQGSLRYQIPFCLSPSRWSAFSVGFDYKGTNNDMLYDNGATKLGPFVNLTQLVIGFHLDQCTAWGSYRLEADLFGSPLRWLAHQDRQSYSELRPFARPLYAYMRGLAEGCVRLPYRFSLKGWLVGQMASNNLLPSEQFILGGADSVRGYPEKQFLADHAVLLKAELHSTLPFRFWGACFTALAFLDYGVGWVNHPIRAIDAPGVLRKDEAKRESLLGVGPALRMKLGCWLTACMDVGFAMNRLPNLRKYSKRIYFTVVARY